MAIDDGPADTESARVTRGRPLVVRRRRRRPPRPDDLLRPALPGAVSLARAGRGRDPDRPAAFTERTGRDHWEVLLRARAIENAAYVLAPSQIGGPPGQTAYGRSMVVDPWGTVVAQAPDTVGIVTAELDLGRVASLRRQIPALANRRPELYGPTS